MDIFQKASNTKPIFIVLFIWFLTINFETAQQLYYIRRFDLAQDATYWNLFLFQTYRWIVWGISAHLLVLFAKKKSGKDNLSLRDFYQYTLVIIALVFIDILIISVIQILISENTFSFLKMMTEYFTFFSFQKGPIYTLGFIAVSVILHFYFSNKYLQIEVLQIEELKKSNAELYQKIKSNFTDKDSILTIKVGNNQKIIPTNDIYWIQADDYCSRVHTVEAPSYAMRISLKALEQKLNPNFLRVHRGAIINMKMVREFQLQPSARLILKNDVEVHVSKSKLKLVKNFLADLAVKN